MYVSYDSRINFEQRNANAARCVYNRCVTGGTSFNMYGGLGALAEILFLLCIKASFN